MPALLSAKAEKDIELAWKLNVRSHSNILELARHGLIKKDLLAFINCCVWTKTPKENTPQYTIMEPNTVYGISKLAGERWNEYYHDKFGVDVRSLRYPGLIGWMSEAGGGTTDYAVNIFHEALKTKKYCCFLKKNTKLPYDVYERCNSSNN